MRYTAYGLLLLLYVLHTDLWYWDDARIVLGMPIGMTYHLMWTLLVTAAFGFAVRYAWPDALDAATPEAPNETSRAADDAAGSS